MTLITKVRTSFLIILILLSLPSLGSALTINRENPIRFFSGTVGFFDKIELEFLGSTQGTIPEGGELLFGSIESDDVLLIFTLRNNEGPVPVEWLLWDEQMITPGGPGTDGVIKLIAAGTVPGPWNDVQCCVSAEDVNLLGLGSGNFGFTFSAPVRPGGQSDPFFFALEIEAPFMRIRPWALSSEFPSTFNNYAFTAFGVEFIVTVNNLVTFDPDPSTYDFTPDTTGCQAGAVGKFSFDAKLTNISEKTLSNLLVEVDELSNDNLLLTNSGLIGEGERFEVSKFDEYDDGILSSDEYEEYVDVPFTVCLKNTKPFRFFVNVLGVATD